MKQQNFILIISSPSGAGKTSIAKEIIQNDNKFSLSISATTREKRPSEIDGKDYYFVSPEKFSSMLKQDEFLEHANVFGNNYGSPKKNIIDKLSSGYDVLFDIDWQGAKTLKEQLGNLVVSIFILPPSIPELEKRLRLRQQDSDEIIAKRMEQSKSEISHYDDYDYVLINEDFNKAMNHINTIITAERLKRCNFDQFVNNLI